MGSLQIRHTCARIQPSVWALLLPALASCTPEAPGSLRELERLAFVSRAPCMLAPGRLDPFGDCSVDRPIVIDLFEYTRGEYLALLEAEVGEEGVWDRLTSGHPWDSDPEGWGPATEDWPAYLTYFDAERAARARGMRLPTGREWVHVAVGRHGLRYPWGEDQDSVANTLGTGIGAPTPVGTFANGRNSLFGCYDMVGNVWEWVSDAVPSRMDNDVDRHVLREALSSASGASVPELSPHAEAARRVSIMGGAFNTPKRATYGPARDSPDTNFHARRVDKGVLSPAIGVRMCADADTYLWEQASRWGAGEEVHRRVAAVGRRWAKDRLAREQLGELLAELRERPGAPAALGWLAEGVGERAQGSSAE